MSWHRAVALACMSVLIAMCGEADACTAVPLPLASVHDKLGMPIDGQVSQAWACKDSAGEHVVLATRQDAPEPLRGTQIQFSKLTRSGGSWKRDWLARDFLLDGGNNLTSNEIVLLKDVDGDGLAEVFVAYVLPGQTGEQDNGKLLVYYKNHKYAIRGAIARTASDFGSRKLDADFQTLPASVQAQALQLWDRLSMPGGMNNNPLLRIGDPPSAGQRQPR